MGHLQRLLLATALGLSVMPAAQAQLPSGPSVRSGRVGIQRSGKILNSRTTELIDTFAVEIELQFGDTIFHRQNPERLPLVDHELLLSD